MKITDVTVTLWEWEDIPPMRYTLTVASSGSGRTQMGLVRIRTDEGVEGHSFIGSNSLNNVANLHLIMAIPNCEYFEVLLPDEVQKHGLIEDIDVDENGMVYAFDGPGLGAKIDFDLIEQNKLTELT